MPAHVPEAGEEVVGPQTGGEFERPERAAPIEREDELLRPHQVRREALQALALAHRLEHQAHVTLLEVAEPAVDQLRRPARRAGREVAALYERHSEPAHGRVARYAGAVDAAAHYEDVERIAAERGERVTSPGLGLPHSE